MTRDNPDVSEVIATGLDALTNGKGFGIHHERARLLANASPELLRKARAVVGAWKSGELAGPMGELADIVTDLDLKEISTTFPDAERK